MSKSMGLDSLRLTVQAIMQMLRKKADANKVVSSVNGAVPDKNGNVVVDIPEGFSGSWNDLQDKPITRNPQVAEGEVPVFGPYEVTTDYITGLGSSDIGFDCSKYANVELVTVIGDTITPLTYSVSDDGAVEVKTHVLKNEYVEFGALVQASTSVQLKHVKVPNYTEPFTVAVYRKSDLTYPEKLDLEFIPDSIARKTDIPTEYVKNVNGVSPDESGNIEVFSGYWDDLQSKPFYKITSVAEGVIPEFGPFEITTDAYSSITFNVNEYEDAELVTVIGDTVTPLVYSYAYNAPATCHYLENEYVKFDIVFGPTGRVSSNRVIALNYTEPFTVAVYYASDIGVKETINEDSIPSSVKLPTVTDADAGKFLRVSADGKWVAESIANAEEASF